MKTLLLELVGVAGVVVGVGVEFGAGWASIVGGVIVGAVGFVNDWGET